MELDIANLRREVRQLMEIMSSMTTSVASMRGMINKRLYSGKLAPELPSWLKSNLEQVGFPVEKDKSSDELGMI